MAVGIPGHTAAAEEALNILQPVRAYGARERSCDTG
jgi:hypothetical protein